MGNLLCLLIGLLLPVLGLAAVARQILRPLAATNAYRNVAWRLGLEADTHGAALQGHLGGQRLFIGTLREGSGPLKHRGVLDLANPLGLGLRLRSRGRPWPRWRRVRGTTLQLGDPELDPVVEVRGYDPDRVRALFVDDVRTALLDLIARWSEVEVTDHWVRVRLNRPPGSEPALMELVTDLQRIGAALDAARRAVPPAPEAAAYLPSWRALASTHGLTLDSGLVTLSGTLHGHPVRVTCVRVEDGVRADVSWAFGEHAPIGLRVEPEDTTDDYWASGQDVEVGDPPFDAAFIIAAWDPYVVRQVLVAPVRDALMALADLGRVRVSDHALTVNEVAADADTLQAIFDHAKRVQDHIQWPPADARR